MPFLRKLSIFSPTKKTWAVTRDYGALTEMGARRKKIIHASKNKSWELVGRAHQETVGGLAPCERR